MDITIRNEEMNDIEQVHHVIRSALPTDAECKLVDALRLGGNAVISLVAA